MANISANDASLLRATGSPVPISLLELQTISGARLYVSDAPCAAASILSAFDHYTSGISHPEVETGFMPDIGIIHPVHGPLTAPVGGYTPSYATVQFLNWILSPPAFPKTASLLTSSADCALQNLLGDTVNRANTQIFTQQQLWGALFVYRLYNPASEFAYVTHIGNVSDIPSLGDTLQLTLRSWMNFSEIKAPDGSIDDNSCLNVFGSLQCGSTSSTICQNTYGSCSSLSRFKGLVPVWNNSAVTQPLAIAQQVPNVDLNLRRYM